MLKDVFEVIDQEGEDDRLIADASRKITMTRLHFDNHHQEDVANETRVPPLLADAELP